MFHVDNSTLGKNGEKFSSKQITLVTVSVVVVVFITALVAVYLFRYEGVFVIALLVVKSAFFITNGRISFERPPWEIQGGVVGHRERSCFLCKRLCSKATKALLFENV